LRIHATPSLSHRAKGKIIDLNPAGVELFGFDRAEWKEIDVRQVYAEPAEREQTTQAIESQGFVQDYPVRMRRKDGGELDALITSSVWQDGESNETGYQGIVRDVTERRRIEAELEQHRHHLEELVQVRTAQAASELAERQRAQEALQRRVQELSSLNEMAKTISTVTDLKETLELLTGSVTELFATTAVLITMLDRERAQVLSLALYAGSLLPKPWGKPAFDLMNYPDFDRWQINKSRL